MDKYDAMEAAEKAEMYADEQRDIIAELMQQRDELLAALVAVKKSSEWSCMEAETQELVCAAIAKATGAK